MKELPHIKFLSLTILPLLFLTGSFCSAYSQGNNALSKSIVARLTAFSQSHPAEKAYLQFDKPYYAAGDTIYFKAYVTLGEKHQLSGLSGLLHVDLINTKNKIDQSIKLKLDSGVAWGDFALPDSLPKGNYRVRAYTQWMRNNSDPEFFDRVIPIGSTKAVRIPESLVKQPVNLNLKSDLQFFPEGGSLVSGVSSKVAFKAVGANGFGVDMKGVVVDEDGKEITSFESAHLGMGFFYLTPADGKSYNAKVTWPNGMQDIIKLPAPEASGIVLSVNNDYLPKASVRIEASPEYYKNNRNKDYALVIYSQGMTTTVNCKLDNPLIKLDILKRKLHTGVATVTLFSSDNKPLCERLLFIQNYDQLCLNVNSDQAAYAKRAGANIKLNVLNRKGEPAAGHFSVAVIDESNVPENEKNGDNILSYLLLTSDLKGYIEQPDYYFADTTATARKNLDILMLTQGYRRFTWKQVLGNTNQPLTFQPEKGIEISGQVKNVFNKPVARGTINLIPVNKGPILSSPTDDKGMFRFSNLIFTDTAHYVLSAVNAKGRNSTKIAYFDDKEREPLVAANRQQVVVAVSDTAMMSYISNDNLQQDELVKYGHAKGIMLKQVNIRDKKRDDQYHTESLAGAGHADQVMHADELQKVPGGQLSDRLAGRLHGVIFNGGNPVLLTMGNMAVYIDGVRMNLDPRDPIGINILSPNDVETIEVLKYANAAIYGMDGGNGVLVITTKQGAGRDPKDIVSIGVLPISPMGFYKAREFYSPKYDNAGLNGRQRDLRSTIYWKPELKTDKDGNVSFNYYNADGTGNYKIVVEGIDNNGNIGRQVYRYKVE